MNGTLVHDSRSALQRLHGFQLVQVLSVRLHQTFVYAGVQLSNFPVECSVPQVSVLGPSCFISYTEDIVDLLESHAVQSHLCADDTQFHDNCRPEDIDVLRNRLSHCASDIISWCTSRHLQLNANKTEAIWVGSKSNLAI